MMPDVATVADELTHLGHVIAVTERTAKHAEDPFPWELSLQGLYAHRGKLVGELKGALNDSDMGVRQAAARALGELGGDEVVPALVEALEDECAQVRSASIWALSEVATDSAVSAIAEALRLKGEDTQCVAILALTRIGDGRAISALTNMRSSGRPRAEALLELALSLVSGEAPHQVTPP